MKRACMNTVLKASLDTTLAVIALMQHKRDMNVTSLSMQPRKNGQTHRPQNFETPNWWYLLKPIYKNIFRTECLRLHRFPCETSARWTDKSRDNAIPVAWVNNQHTHTLQYSMKLSPCAPNLQQTLSTKQLNNFPQPPFTPWQWWPAYGWLRTLLCRITAPRKTFLPHSFFN